MKNIRYIIISAFALVVLSAAAQGRAYEPQSLSPDRKLGYAERLIEAYYLDDVDGEKLAEEAIVAMLKTLDPHSSYHNAKETEEMTQPLDGNFSGIGIQFNMLNDTLIVIQTIAGGPSEKVGIRPGDKILNANGEAVSGAKKANSDIIKMLRGPKGTEVEVEVARRGVDRPIAFRIVRDDIPINSVDAAFMADPTTGYIRLSRFAETTDREFNEAIAKLRKQGMQNLIIDLEDNGGGYLGSAVNVASHLLRKGDLITYTEAPKLERSDYRAPASGNFSNGRVVVMVNQYSASASEILSGAVQDHDRGLIVGRRTFGKGLVQRPFPFPDGSMIKLTVSRYHTPSGRSIQKPYEVGKAEDYAYDMKTRYENGEFFSADKIQFPDSLKFSTLKNKRTVYGGGGIMPDVFVPIDTTAYSEYYRDLVAKGVLNRWAITYVDDNRARLHDEYPTEDSFIDRFEVTPEMFDRIIEMGRKDGVEYNEEQFTRSRGMIAPILKGLVGRDLFEQSTYYRIVQPALNDTYRAALRLINSPDYTSLLRK